MRPPILMNTRPICCVPPSPRKSTCLAWNAAIHDHMLANPCPRTSGRDLGKWLSAAVVINKRDEMGPHIDSPRPGAALVMPNSQSAYPLQTPDHHLLDNMVDSSFIKGEGWLSHTVVNKDLMKEGEDSLPVPVGVLPTEPFSSQIEIPECSSQCSMLKDSPGHQVSATAHSIIVVNAKWLPDEVAISIKKSQSVLVHSPSSWSAFMQACSSFAG